MKSKKRTTFAKLAREQRLKERRALKLEKKQAAARGDAGESVDTPPPTPE